ncbi:MAG: hypothetical protein AAF196_05510 [Planctomycetota bacterium]
MGITSEVLSHRRLILRRVRAELRFRYSGTALGLLWLLLHPALLVGAYALIFGLVRGNRDDFGTPYAWILCSGLLPWIGFAEAVSRSTNALKTNRAYLKKLPAPEHVYVLQAALTAVAQSAITMLVLLAVGPVLGISPTMIWLALPIPFFALAMLGTGLGLCLAPLNVVVPDVGELVPVALRLGLWAVPTILPYQLYVDAGVGEVVRALPAGATLIAFQDLLGFGRWPEPLTWVWMLGWPIVAWVAGTFVFRRIQPELKDLL